MAAPQIKGDIAMADTDQVPFVLLFNFCFMASFDYKLHCEKKKRKPTSKSYPNLTDKPNACCYICGILLGFGRRKWMREDTDIEQA